MKDQFNSGGTRYLDKDGRETPRPDKSPHDDAAAVKPVDEKRQQKSVITEDTGGKK